MASPRSARQLVDQRQNFEKRIATALETEDDPLDVYVQYVQWITENYDANDSNSGLTELLRKATDAFKGDLNYKADLRYLKLWSLYTKRVPTPTALKIWTNLVGKEIGTTYSLLYEEFAAVLEASGRITEAGKVYKSGIKRQSRPLERLKTKYAEFQKRHGSSSSSAPAPAPTASSSSSSVRSKTKTIPESSSSSSTVSASYVSTAESRYAVMTAPQTGKRPEVLRFHMHLLYTPETGEFCIQEARAKSMGLLGKKWPPLPENRTTYQVSLNDNPKNAARSGGIFGGSRKSIMSGEPTVTINTKEALADVFGMYNSPDRTTRFTGPGSKHASLKRVDVMTPRSISPSQAKTPTPAMRPLVDENLAGKPLRPFVDKDKTITPLKPFVDENAATPFKPFVDPEPLSKSLNSSRRGLKESQAEKQPAFTPFVDAGSNQQPTTTPRNTTLKESSSFTPFADPLSRGSTSPADSATSSQPPPRKPLQVFVDPSDDERTSRSGSNPPLAPFRDVFTEGHGKPAEKPVLHERAKSQDSVPLSTSDAGAPAFRVFSRPESGQNVFAPPKSGLQESAVFTQPPKQEPEPEEEEDYDEDFLTEDHVVPLPPEDEDNGDYPYSEAPLGGRFGHINVMTPITERTFEYTTTNTRSAYGANTPSGKLRPQMEEPEMLADEDLGSLEVSSGPIASQEVSSRDDSGVEVLEEQTGKLSLVDTLALSNNFRPPNPCNPFDPPILNTLLSRWFPDKRYVDLRGQDADLLAGLERHFKKARKTSGGSSFDNSTTHAIRLGNEKYQLSAKLGEGGFGSVFLAKEMGAAQKDIDEDEEDEDDLDLDDLDEDEDEVKYVAVKVVKPRNLWEYHVLRKLHPLLPESLQRSVVQPHGLYAFRDESFLVLQFCPQGSLLNIVNNAVAAGVSQQGGSLDELLVAFFAVELLRLLNAMHTIGFIHGDLKIDNCLLRLEDVPGGSSAWSSQYNPLGENGWACKGISLIDFGRTIDTRQFPAGQQFIAEWASDERDCYEIQEGRPWTFQTDYFGLAGIVYCMLFGKYIQASAIVTDSDGTRRIGTPFKRYWQAEIWQELFRLLLNPTQCRLDHSMPLTEELTAVRVKLEDWIKANCNRSTNTLKGLLKKVEMASLR